MWLYLQCWKVHLRFSYSWFHNLRQEISKNIWLWNLEEFYSWNKKFPSLKNEPIVQLLNHSDYNWILRPTIRLINRLKQIEIENDYLKDQLIYLINLFEYSYNMNKKIIFK